jgi:hypothetical protein
MTSYPQETQKAARLSVLRHPAYDCDDVNDGENDDDASCVYGVLSGMPFLSTRLKIIVGSMIASKLNICRLKINL